MKRAYILAASAFAFAVSCKQNEPNLPSIDGSELSILTTVAPSESGSGRLVGPAGSQFKAGVVATRISVTNNVFENNDKIGLYVVEWAGANASSQTIQPLEAAGNLADNHRYTYRSTAGTSWGANSWTAGKLPNPLTWRKVSVFTYHPYSAAITDALNLPFTAREDQRSGVASGEYLMWGVGKNNTAGYAPTTDLTPIELDFKHKSAHITVKVTLPEYYNGTRITDITAATVLDVPLKSKLNLSTGVLTVDAASKKPVLMQKKAGTNIREGEFYAVVNPYLVPAGREIVKIDYTGAPSNGSLFLYADHTGFEFNENTRYNITLTTEEFGFNGNLTPFEGDVDGVQMVTIKSTHATLEWTVKSGDNAWISFPDNADITTVKGTGDKTFKVKVLKNTTNQTRMSKIVLTRSDKLNDVEMVVFQKANIL